MPSPDYLHGIVQEKFCRYVRFCLGFFSAFFASVSGGAVVGAVFGFLPTVYGGVIVEMWTVDARLFVVGDFGLILLKLPVVCI